jgi:SAM-dependent methyltransferase
MYDLPKRLVRRAVSAGRVLAKGLPPMGLQPIRPVRLPGVAPVPHPEAEWLRPLCVGRGIDVGCGQEKVDSACIGVDIIPTGVEGAYGVVAGRKSVADVHASGDDLRGFFTDGELDYVVSRHNLEHYIDVVRTLREWRRVLKVGGRLGVVVPDERAGDTVYLDPTHKHVFTPDSLKTLVEVVGGFRVDAVEDVIAGWSFGLKATRLAD